MMMPNPSPVLKMVVPKGRLQENVQELLKRSGIRLAFNGRTYRPVCSDPAVAVKLLKPQNIPAMVALGRHDCGFVGYDWIVEQHLDNNETLIERLDLGFNPVKIIAAVPEALTDDTVFRSAPRIIASEYETLTQQYIEKKGLDAVFIKAHGATEALPPEDADMIIDNTATGQTLKTNRLVIVDELLRSTTRFVCSRTAWNDPWKQEKLLQLEMLMKSCLNADKKVLLEMNVDPAHFDQLIVELPSMQSPTISPLYNEAGFAIKIAVPAGDVAQLIPKLVQLGARDILEYSLEKIVS